MIDRGKPHMNAIANISEYQSLSRVAEQDACCKAGEALAHAFGDDPVLQYAIPNAIARRKVLPLFYEKLSRVATVLGGAELRAGSAAALWLESRMDAPFWLSVRLGFLRILFRIGPVALLRLMRHEGQCAMRARRVGPPRYGYLWVIGVAPPSQNQGHGRALLNRTLEVLRGRGHSVCLLKTETESTVAFYREAGFSCLDTSVIPSSGIRYWLMQKALT